MGLNEAVTEIGAVAKGLLAGSMLLTDPGAARAGTQATVAVYRDSITAYRLGRVQHVLVSFQSPQAAPYTRPEQINAVSNAVDGMLDYVHHAQPGGMSVYWPSGVAVAMDYDDGAHARVDIPLCAPEEYARIG